MKRIFALVLVLCLLLCGCKKTTPEATTGATLGTPSVPVTEPAPIETPIPPSTEATQPTQPPKQEVLYRHPLTGAPLDAPWSGRATAVVVNNLKAALPQSGISQADIFYEVEVEGDITRCLAVFTDFSNVGNIGSVRSARTYFNSLAVSYNAPLIHCGGSQGLALAGRYDDSGDVIENWQHIDQASYGSYFFRDMDRYKSGVAWEHCLFTTGERLQQALKDRRYDTAESRDYGLLFDDGVVLNGETANEVTVKFKGGKTTTLAFDAEKQGYKMIQHGQEHIDGNTQQAVTFQNVIVIYTNQRVIDNVGHKIYDTIGTGKGYAAINGQIVPITWTRETLRDNYTYTLEDGTPLTMESGKTYIAMVGIKHEIAYK